MAGDCGTLLIKQDAGYGSPSRVKTTLLLLFRSEICLLAFAEPRPPAKRPLHQTAHRDHPMYSEIAFVSPAHTFMPRYGDVYPHHLKSKVASSPVKSGPL